MCITFDIPIFSPRWGRQDTYSIRIDRDFMEITMQVRTARAIWRDSLDPEWSKQTIQDIMENDQIYAPAIIQDLFEYAWEKWRNGEISDEVLVTELQGLGRWINTITRERPDTKFWNSYF